MKRVIIILITLLAFELCIVFGGKITGLWPSDKATRLDVPFYVQKYSLSCTTAALRMALAFKGEKIEEDTLIEKLAFDTKEPALRDITTGKILFWGDPNRGFVGEIDGVSPITGYGVYEKPLQDVALQYRNTRILTKKSVYSLTHQIHKGNPVIVWISVTDGKDISWRNENGMPVQAIDGAHARLLVGFRGSAIRPKSLIFLDPSLGEREVALKNFLLDWDKLGRRALAVH